MPGRPRIDWEAAFQMYAALGVQRSYVAVARELGCDPRSVERAAFRYGWHERVAEIERKAQAEAEKRLVRDRADRVTDTIRIIDAARTKFAGQLRIADFRLTGSDFVGLVKLEQLLEGEATDRLSLVDILGEQLHALIGGILADLGVLDRPDVPAIVRRRMLALEKPRDDEAA